MKLPGRVCRPSRGFQTKQVGASTTSQPGHEIGRLNAECSGECLNGLKPDRTLSPFDERDMCPVQLCCVCQGFLGQISLFSEHPYPVPEVLLECALCHLKSVAGPQTIRLQTMRNTRSRICIGPWSLSASGSQVDGGSRWLRVSSCGDTWFGTLTDRDRDR